MTESRHVIRGDIWSVRTSSGKLVAPLLYAVLFNHIFEAGRMREGARGSKTHAQKAGHMHGRYVHKASMHARGEPVVKLSETHRCMESKQRMKFPYWRQNKCITSDLCGLSYISADLETWDMWNKDPCNLSWIFLGGKTGSRINIFSWDKGNAKWEQSLMPLLVLCGINYSMETWKIYLEKQRISRESMKTLHIQTFLDCKHLNLHT